MVGDIVFEMNRRMVLGVRIVVVVFFFQRNNGPRRKILATREEIVISFGFI